MKQNKQTSLSLFLALLFTCSSYSTFLYSSEKNILFIKRKREERKTKKMPIIDHPNKKQKHYSNDNISNDNSSDKDEIGDFLHLPQSTENRPLFVPLDPNNKNKIEKKTLRLQNKDSSKENIQKYEYLKKKRPRIKKKKNKKQKLSPNNSSNNISNDNSSDRKKICKLLNLSEKTNNRFLFAGIVEKLDPYNKKRIEKIKTSKRIYTHQISYLIGRSEGNIKSLYKKILPILQDKTQLDIRKRVLRELKLPLDANNEELLLKLQDIFNNPEARYFYQFTKPHLKEKTLIKDVYKNIFQRLQNEDSSEKRKPKIKKKKRKKQKLSSNNNSNNNMSNDFNDNSSFVAALQEQNVDSSNNDFNDNSSFVAALQEQNVDSSDRDKICKFFNISTDIENQDLFTKIVKKLDLYNTHKIETIETIEKIETIETSNPNNSSNRDKICDFFHLPRNTKNRQLFVEIVKYLDPYNKNRIKKIETSYDVHFHNVSYLLGNIAKIEDFYKKILLILQGKIQLDIKKRLQKELELPLNSKNEELILKLQNKFNNPEAIYFYQFTKPPLKKGERLKKDIYENILQRLQNKAKSEEDDSFA